MIPNLLIFFFLFVPFFFTTFQKKIQFFFFFVGDFYQSQVKNKFLNSVDNFPNNEDSAFH